MSNAARNREVILMGEDILLKSKAGDIGAYLATPKGTPKGGVVVIQEIFGVNHHIKAVTDKFAADGYIALAPRFFDHIKKASSSATRPTPSPRAAAT